MLKHFTHSTVAQDLIEYALLTAFVGLLGVVAWPSVQTQIGLHYGNMNTAQQHLSACTPDPIANGGGGCP